VDGAKFSRYVFIGMLLVLLYLAFKLAQPFLMYIFLGVIFAIALHPLYNWLCKVLKHRKISSFVTIILILLIIIMPTSLVVGALTVQAKSIIQSVNLDQLFSTESFNQLNDYVVKYMGPKADLREKINDIIAGVGDFIIKSAIQVASSVVETTLGIFVMFFVMYYGFVEGEELVKKTRGLLPLEKGRKEKLVKSIKDVTKMVIYGDLLISLLQGILGGLGLFMIGVPNAVFWGFIMMILAFLPVIGTGLVWIPIGIMEITNNNTIGGIFILVYGIVVILGVDTLLRPNLVSGGARIHPIAALVGLLGGMKLFGFLGIVLGPVIAALFITMAEFFYQDYIKSPDTPKDDVLNLNIRNNKPKKRLKAKK
jgi:predicted PurR-regulated permease PerM